jgi:hypothetical protein
MLSAELQKVTKRVHCDRRPPHARYFFAHMIGIRIADTRQAMPMKPAGVALSVASTETHLPMDTFIVALISSGWGAAVGDSWARFASMALNSEPVTSDFPCSFWAI